MILKLLDIENEPLVEEINENEIESDNEEKCKKRFFEIDLFYEIIKTKNISIWRNHLF